MERDGADGMVPIDECEHGVAYWLSSRNLTVGVYDAEQQGFVGIREKFGNRFLFTEYHVDTGAPFGTARALRAIGSCPVESLEEHERGADRCSMHGRAVHWSGPPAPAPWVHDDDGSELERGVDHPQAPPTNQALFDWLAPYDAQAARALEAWQEAAGQDDERVAIGWIAFLDEVAE